MNRNSNLKNLIQFRKDLRNKSTAAEAVLWSHIKSRKLLGRKFRRQHSIGNFIMDFYCPSEKLCIELDGSVHYCRSGILRDKEKFQFLKSQGIKVIRFENKYVHDDINFVLSKIIDEFNLSEQNSPPAEDVPKAQTRIGGAPSERQRRERVRVVEKNN